MVGDSSPDAIVVGSGPNGLAAALTLARAGLFVRVYEGAPTIGGGCRTSELTLPEHRHDVCSAIHPFGVGSPFLRSLPLDEHGLEWVHPEIALAHPLDDGQASVLTRSIDETAASLGADADTYRQLVSPYVERWHELAAGLLGPVNRSARHPILLTRFAIRGLRSAHTSAARFTTDGARALWAGLAAHAIAPLDRPLTTGVALLFSASAHAVGWPAARGGSQAIVDAMAAYLRSLGGEVITDHPVRSLADLPRTRVAMFDVMPGALAEIAADRLPHRFRQRLRRYRHGPGVYKVDYALSEPVPWTASECHRAGTVHVGGTFEEIAASEAAPHAGTVPRHPFLITAQQSLFDPTRAPAGRHTFWAYAHVPHGWSDDALALIEDQVERFAPGFRDVIAERSVRTAADLEAGNPNLVGGDIAGGAMRGSQAIPFLRPFPKMSPYATPDPGIYLCSSATPPGAGVHGMCGHHAARVALRRVFGRRVTEQAPIPRP